MGSTSFGVDRVALEQGGWHRGNVKGSENATGLAGRLGVGCDGAKQRVADVEIADRTIGALDANSAMVNRVLERIAGIGACGVQTVRNLARHLH